MYDEVWLAALIFDLQLYLFIHFFHQISPLVGGVNWSGDLAIASGLILVL
jgi:hypothetical protein